LVTGSRAWKDARPIVWAALDREFEECPDEQDFEVIHGGAQGPDRDAQAWVDDYIERYDPERFAGVSARRFDPDYRQFHATVAPLIRNQIMVDERPYRCLAFHWGASTGTNDCIERALRASIEVHIYRPGQPEPEIIAPLF
jgi:hypothetical protein